jgi:hypothetical protein
MATLTNTKVKDTYQTLLKLTSGSIGGGYTVVQDGEANDSGLSLSTSRIGVLGLTFINQPPTGSAMTAALFVNTTSGDVYKQELAASAFTNPSVVAGTGISVSGGFPTFTVANTAPDQTVTFTGTDISIGGAYPNFTLVNTAPDQVVSINAGSDLSVSGTYPSFILNHTINSFAVFSDGTPNQPINASGANQSISFVGGTGITTSADNTTKTLTITNDAPDQVVTITGTNDATVTGTYPNFNIDVVAGAGSGVHEEMFVGVPESPYPLAPNSAQPVAFSVADNSNEAVSSHFGTAPAQLQRAAGGVGVDNISGQRLTMYIDMSAFVEVQSPNSDITYHLERFDTAQWNKVKSVTRYKGYTGLQVDSFWGIFIVDAGESVRIVIESDSGNVTLNELTQIKFEVKEIGNII